ncbi:ABC transporter permease [Caldalkalibacillus thermarum TA2.A1]|uniref:ABC transporter permease n=1 Tax=Caldalkalibacillus thermarum (strain TA2.A1) TaxID=986075 RepID=A0A8X8IA80_CALTT|nr:ABC transporter permease [Caldalkalibacillus thermarum]QZT34621.1 ABC transporter permease [Caldalkalibacillus thermarum TA2.A1]
MFRLILRSLWQQKGMTLMFILAFTLILTTVPLALMSLKEMITQIQDDITQYGRGSYDILVRPQGARNTVEQTWGVVEENYLGAGRGGISLAEWQKIKNIEGVEVAAPVASLGYFTGITKSYALWMPEQSIRITHQFLTTNGIQRYPLTEPLTGLFLEQEPVAGYIDQFDRLADEELADQFVMWDPPLFVMPPTYHLLVGIDPDEEEKLTGISFQDLNRPLTPDEEIIYEFAQGAPIIKVLKLKDPHVPLLAEITLETLDIGPEETLAFKQQLGLNHEDLFMFEQGSEAYRNLLAELKRYPALTQETWTFDFSPYLDPFESIPLRVDQEGNILKNDQYSMFSHHGLSARFFIADPIDYQVHGDTLKVNQVGTMGGIPVYRQVEQQGGRLGEVDKLPFVLHPVGEYEIGERQEELAASPLGIYQLAPVQLIKNLQGEEVEPKEVLPTILPGSFVPSPAHGVISIFDAELIKGERPIDAIRIRVSGITTYDKQAEEKIKHIAGQIAQMGFEVDIVAGASHQQVEVEVQGLGVVTQPWTTLGAAARIVEGWNLSTLAMTLLFVAISYFYLFNRFLYWRVTKRKELELLHQLGWARQTIRRYFRCELLCLLLLALVLSGLGLAVIQQTSNVPSVVYILHSGLWLSSSGALLVAAGPLLSKKMAVKPVPTWIRGFPPALGTLKSVWFYRAFLTSSFMQLLMVSILSAFLLLTINETISQTNVTVLGQYINMQIKDSHVLILLSACMIVLVTLIETLMTLLSIRQREVETLQAVGWKRKHIFRTLAGEVSIWSIAAIILGHFIGTTLFVLVYNVSHVSLVYVLLPMILYYSSILMITFMVVYSFTKRRLHVSLAKGL